MVQKTGKQIEKCTVKNTEKKESKSTQRETKELKRWENQDSSYTTCWKRGYALVGGREASELLARNVPPPGKGKGVERGRTVGGGWNSVRTKVNRFSHQSPGTLLKVAQLWYDVWAAEDKGNDASESPGTLLKVTPLW